MAPPVRIASVAVAVGRPAGRLASRKGLSVSAFTIWKKERGEGGGAREEEEEEEEEENVQSIPFIDISSPAPSHWLYRRKERGRDPLFS